MDPTINENNFGKDMDDDEKNVSVVNSTFPCHDANGNDPCVFLEKNQCSTNHKNDHHHHDDDAMVMGTRTRTTTTRWCYCCTIFFLNTLLSFFRWIVFTIVFFLFGSFLSIILLLSYDLLLLTVTSSYESSVSTENENDNVVQSSISSLQQQQPESIMFFFMFLCRSVPYLWTTNHHYYNSQQQLQLQQQQELLMDEYKWLDTCHSYFMKYHHHATPITTIISNEKSSSFFDISSKNHMNMNPYQDQKSIEKQTTVVGTTNHHPSFHGSSNTILTKGRNKKRKFVFIGKKNYNNKNNTNINSKQQQQYTYPLQNDEKEKDDQQGIQSSDLLLLLLLQLRDDGNKNVDNPSSLSSYKNNWEYYYRNERVLSSPHWSSHMTSTKVIHTNKNTTFLKKRNKNHIPSDTTTTTKTTTNNKEEKMETTFDHDDDNDSNSLTYHLHPVEVNVAKKEQERLHERRNVILNEKHRRLTIDNNTHHKNSYQQDNIEKQQSLQELDKELNQVQEQYDSFLEQYGWLVDETLFHEKKKNKNKKVLRTTTISQQQHDEHSNSRNLLDKNDNSNNENSNNHDNDYYLNAVYTPIPNLDEPYYRSSSGKDHDHPHHHQERNLKEYYSYRHLSRYEKHYRTISQINLQINWNGLYHHHTTTLQQWNNDTNEEDTTKREEKNKNIHLHDNNFHHHQKTSKQEDDNKSSSQDENDTDIGTPDSSHLEGDSFIVNVMKDIITTTWSQYVVGNRTVTPDGRNHPTSNHTYASKLYTQCREYIRKTPTTRQLLQRSHPRINNNKTNVSPVHVGGNNPTERRKRKGRRQRRPGDADYTFDTNTLNSDVYVDAPYLRSNDDDRSNRNEYDGNNSSLIDDPTINIETYSMESMEEDTNLYTGGRFDNYQQVPLSQGYGTHFSNVWVGSPAPQRKTVIVDTGSHYTAFPCSGCSHCGAPHHTDPYYKPELSTSFHQLQCNECQDRIMCDNGQCKFHQAYTEGSSWEAIQVRDRFFCGGTDVLDSVDPNDQKYTIDFMFGCQYSMTGLFITQLADGIMGMSAHPATLPKRLFDAKKIEHNMFAMCYRRELGTSKRGVTAGSMTLGGVSNSLDTSPMVYAKNIAHGGWYTVYVKAIYIRTGGGQSARSDVSDSTKHQTIKVRLDPVALNSGKGVIVDSGTTDTYLNKRLARDFTKAWKQATGKTYSHTPMQLTTKELHNLPTILIQCQSYSNDVDPSVENYDNVVGYAGKLDPKSPKDLLIAIPATSYMDYSPLTKKYMSRLYFTESVGGVLGSNAMQGHNVLFDWQNGRVGFAESTCEYDKKDVPQITMDDRYQTDCAVSHPILTKSCIETVDRRMCRNNPTNIALLGTETWTAIVLSPGNEAGTSCVDAAQGLNRVGSKSTEYSRRRGQNIPNEYDEIVVQCDGKGYCYEERPCQLTCKQATAAALVKPLLTPKQSQSSSTQLTMECGDSYWSACDYGCVQTRIVSKIFSDGLCHEVSRESRPCHIGACARHDTCRVPVVVHVVAAFRGGILEEWDFHQSNEILIKALTNTMNHKYLSRNITRLFGEGDVHINSALPWYGNDYNNDDDVDDNELGSGEKPIGVKVVIEISMYNPLANRNRTSSFDLSDPNDENKFVLFVQNITDRVRFSKKQLQIQQNKSGKTCRQDELYAIAKLSIETKNLIQDESFMSNLIDEIKVLVNGNHVTAKPFGPLLENTYNSSECQLLSVWTIRTGIEEEINFFGPHKPLVGKVLAFMQNLVLLFSLFFSFIVCWNYCIALCEYRTGKKYTYYYYHWMATTTTSSNEYDVLWFCHSTTSRLRRWFRYKTTATTSVRMMEDYDHSNHTQQQQQSHEKELEDPNLFEDSILSGGHIEFTTVLSKNNNNHHNRTPQQDPYQQQQQQNRTTMTPTPDTNTINTHRSVLSSSSYKMTRPQKRFVRQRD